MQTKYKVGDIVDYTKLRWESDWNGYEVGYPEVDVVGLYSFEEEYYYIDVVNGGVLEVYQYDDDEV